jgi:hypothetical protein
MWFKVNHVIKFNETHTIQSLFYDVNIAAGRHHEWDKPNPFYKPVTVFDSQKLSLLCVPISIVTTVIKPTKLCLLRGTK